MIESEGKEDGLLEMPDPATLNLTALMLAEQGGGAVGPEGIMDMEPAGRVKDGLLESFLQNNFPDEEVRVVLVVCVCVCGWGGPLIDDSHQ